MAHWDTPPMPRRQTVLFPRMLDETIPEDHPVRLLYEILERMDWSAWEARYGNGAGRPAIPPKVLAAVLLHGLSVGVRSSHKLEYACRNWLDFIWLAEGRPLDHSTLCNFRTQFAQELKDLFVQVGRLAIAMGAACLGTIGLDGTRVRANSSRHATASAATLEQRLAEAQEEMERRFAEVEAADASDKDLFGLETPRALPPGLAKMGERLEQLEKALRHARAAAKRSKGKDKGKGDEPPAAGDESASTSDAPPAQGAAAAEPASQSEPLPAGPNAQPTQGDGQPGATEPVQEASAAPLEADGSGKPAKKPKVPVADPDSTVVPNKEGGHAPNHTPMAATESKGGYILYADVVDPHDPQGRTGEGQQVLLMLDRIKEDFGKTPEQLLADTAFGSGENLEGLESRGIEGFIPQNQRPRPANNPATRADPRQPVPEGDWPKLPMNARTKRLDRAAFVYDGKADCYYCPLGHVLPRVRTTTRRGSGKPVAFHEYVCGDCSGCPLGGRCLGGEAQGRLVTRDQYEPLRETMDTRLDSEEGKAAYRHRAWIAETPNAMLKHWMGIRQFLLRGIEKVRTEWRWACTALNIKKLVRFVGALRAKGMSVNW